MKKIKKIYYRTTCSNFWIGGVLGGLGRYLNISADLIRIIFLFVFFIPVDFTTFLLPLYLVMWILAPEEK
jgi:phage shock protein PspC (stress-responsive transcriptional regulator)